MDIAAAETNNNNNNNEEQLQGVVIITLPPPDNPCLGKTITAFTLSSNHPPQTSSSSSSTTLTTALTHNDEEQGQQPPIRDINTNVNDNNEAGPVQNHIGRRESARRVSYRGPILILPIVAVFVIGLYVWASDAREANFQLRDQIDKINDRHNNNKNKNNSLHTFLLPLYQKPFRNRSSSSNDNEGNLFGEIELKLGLGSSDSIPPVAADENGRINAESLSSSAAVSRRDESRVVPVQGNVYPDGLYYTYLLFGNPPKPYFLDLDTGSDLSWIQCDAPCMSCAKGAHPFYKPVQANIIPPRDSYCVEVQRNQRTNYCDSCHQCDYEIEYADHSSSVGVLARDELHINVGNGSLTTSKVVFGCAYDQQGLLLNTLAKTDGILGLNRARISLPSQLASQGIIENVIGHCLAIDSSGGGYLFLGDDFVPHWQMVWVPMLQDLSTNSYQIEITKLNYGKKQIRLDSAGNGRGLLVFDSGSSYSYFPEQAYNDVITALNDVSSERLVRDLSDTSFPICWQPKSPLRFAGDIGRLFKPLTLQFGRKWWIGSKKLQIPPEGYLVRNNKGNVCLGILNGRKVHDGSTFILGDISLRGLLVVYDNVNEKIGWIRSDCAWPLRPESHSFY